MNQYDDTTKGGYSADEKLALVAGGAMDPKEIGLTSTEEAIGKMIAQASPAEKLEMTKLADFVVFEASECPLAIRANWALTDMKLVLQGRAKDAWIEKWIQDNKDTHLIQARMRCGKVTAVLQQKVTDVVLGFAAIMKSVATELEKKYAEQLRLEKEITESADKGKQPSPTEVTGKDLLPNG